MQSADCFWREMHVILRNGCKDNKARSSIYVQFPILLKTADVFIADSIMSLLKLEHMQNLSIFVQNTHYSR